MKISRKKVRVVVTKFINVMCLLCFPGHENTILRKRAIKKNAKHFQVKKSPEDCYQFAMLCIILKRHQLRHIYKKIRTFLAFFVSSPENEFLVTMTYFLVVKIWVVLCFVS